jgi:hypothetical protein
MECFYEHGNESSGFIEGVEFLDQLSDCQLLKKLCSYVLQSQMAQAPH